MPNNLTYNFGCPFCGTAWSLAQMAVAAEGLFRVGDWTGVGECPSCGRQFGWVREGELEDAPPSAEWWKNKKRRKRKYEPHPCKWCGRTLEGNRKFCNSQCNQKWYYRQKHPVVQRKTPTIQGATHSE